ncbi:uncharacterized protein I206_102455 [Kwoniella pini CBS 10737]|uniref:Uncharacterized protein n=1 Tax=Kwoniella pini CBS 10737 TaxID=1296096 RepID=A0A1B9I5F1_9TREE|nr:uncharacterized protein I206_02805 [Kwoniella pini CBS 10737]OCF50749.1 hypothetical protein I206_02805 [Kwoniella pini CBS 10737]
MNDDGWDDGFHSESYESPDEDEVFDRHALSGNADLVKELDLASRWEPVKFTDTPFTIAARKVRNEPSNQSEPTNLAPSINNSAAPVKASQATAIRSIPPSNNDYGIKNGVCRTIQPEYYHKASSSKDAQLGQSKKRGLNKGSQEKGEHYGPKKPKMKHTGWYDGSGKPVYEEVKPEREKTILEKWEEKEALSKKRSEAAKKGAATRARNRKTKEEEKIKFSILPPNAKASSEYPILQGIERMNDLPLKDRQSHRAQTEQEEARVNVVDKLGTEAINDLICGDSGRHTKNEQDEEMDIDDKFDDEKRGTGNGRMKLTAREISEKERRASMQEILQGKASDTQKKYGKTKASLWAASPLHPSLSSAHSNDHPCPKTKGKNSLDPIDLGSASEEDNSMEQPSTITHLPSSALRDIEKAGESSSEVPLLSSPLDQYRFGDPDTLKSRVIGRGASPNGNQDVRSLGSFEKKDETEKLKRSRTHKEHLLEEARNNAQMLAPQTGMNSRINHRSNVEKLTSDSLRGHIFKARKSKRSSSPEDKSTDKDEEWRTEVPRHGRWNKQALSKSNKRLGRQQSKQPYKPIEIFPKKQYNPKITDNLKIARSPFGDLFAKTDDQGTSTKIRSVGGETKLPLFKPSDPNESKTDCSSNITYTLNTSKGTKYGSTASPIKREKQYRDDDKYTQNGQGTNGGSMISNTNISTASNPSSTYVVKEVYVPIPYSQHQAFYDPNVSSSGGSRHSIEQFRFINKSNNYSDPVVYSNGFAHPNITHSSTNDNRYMHKSQEMEVEEDWTKAWSKSTQLQNSNSIKGIFERY